MVPGIGSREGEGRNLRTGDAEEGGNPQARDRQSLTAWLLQMPGLRRQGYLQEKNVYLEESYFFRREKL